MASEEIERLSIQASARPPYEVEIVRQDVVFRGLPDALHGATFAHVSDLHVGFGNLEKVYEAAVSFINAENVDFILFTGDYVDRRASTDNHQISELLTSFRSKQGKFGCLGNHDSLRGPALTRRFLEKGGVHPLIDERVEVCSGFTIAGLADLDEGAPDIAGTLDPLPTSRTSIVLCHNPKLIDRAGNRDIIILSGHTHGAQFRLRFPSPQMICLIHLGCRQVAGWYQRGKSRLYVNRGLGITGKPYRINCPAEIGIFRMLSDTQTGSIPTRPTR